MRIPRHVVGVLLVSTAACGRFGLEYRDNTTHKGEEPRARCERQCTELLPTSGTENEARAALQFESSVRITSVPYGSSHDFAISFRNQNDTASVQVQSTELSSNLAIVDTLCEETIPARSTCTFGLRFTAPGLGTFEEQISVRYREDESTEQSVSLPVTFMGVAGEVVVEPVYDSHPDWNDYVARNDETRHVIDQDGTACSAPTSETHRACIHSGEKRKAILPGVATCDGIIARDLRSAFDWGCAQIGNKTEIYSLGLKASARLSDLIEFSDGTWKTNRIFVEHQGQTIHTSSTETWWNNRLIALSSVSDPVPATHPIELSEPGAIYYVPTALTSSTGYTIVRDGIGVVVAKGAALSYSPSAPPITNCDGRGTINTTELCLLFSRGQDFLWFEGHFSGRPTGGVGKALMIGSSNFSVFREIEASEVDGIAIDLRTVSHSLFRNIEVHHSGNVGMRMHWNSIYNTATNIVAHNNGGEGIGIRNTRHTELFNLVGTDNGGSGVNLDGTTNVRVEQIRVANNALNGLRISGTTVVTDVVSSNNGNDGLRLNSSKNSVITQVVSTQNGQAGIEITNRSSGNFLAAITTSHNVMSGLALNFSDHTTTLGLVSTNNLSIGASVRTQSDATQMYQSSLAHNGGVELLTDSNDGHFESLRLSAPDDCSISGTGNNVRLVSTLCQYHDGTPLATVDVQSSFVGKVDQDGQNPIVLSQGTFQYGPQAIDWTHFDNRARTIGVDGGDFPDPGNRGPCQGGSTCRFWDWSLTRADNQLRQVVALPDGDTTATHHFEAPDQGSCEALGGTWNQPAAGDCTVEFLLHAFEPLHDGKGNDNGLCESNEACIHMPNHGGYQGHGGLSPLTPFSPGRLISVELFGYAENGRAL